MPDTRHTAITLGLLMFGVSACETPKPSTPRAEAPAASTAGAAPTSAGSSEAAEPSTPASDAMNTIPTSKGDAIVTPLEHGSVMIEWSGKRIYVDPVGSALEAAGATPPGDLVLITHLHGDHLDPAAIAKVRAPGAPVVAPAAAIEKAGDALPSPTAMANGEKATLLDGAVEVEAVAMYNLKRKRDNGEFFHPKGVGNGYVVTMGGARLYFSGDTECTPEMKELEEIDAAFVCMNLPYTMTPEEAAVCVKAFAPRVLYPYHYRGQDPTKLPALLGYGSPVEVRQLEWYPARADAAKHDH